MTWRWWSGTASRESHFDARALLFSSPYPVGRQLPAVRLCGVIIAAVAGGGILLRALAIAVVFVPTLALALGTLSGTRRLFEVIYLLLFSFAFVGMLAVCAPQVAGAPAIHELRRVFPVSDDTLTVPFGAIVDASVGYDGTVYILDGQTFSIRRFDSVGRELAPLGRKGEGPGEFTSPLKVVPYPDGRCLILQDFYQPAVCFTSEGQACEGPDLSSLRRPYFVLIFARAQIDSEGRLTSRQTTELGVLSTV